jgi:seryl-tRNA synthetase
MSKEKTKHGFKVATLATCCNCTDYQAKFVATLYFLRGCYKVATGCYILAGFL